MQEVGGKTYEKSMEYVQDFIQQLCESEQLSDYNRIRIYLDEDYNSAEHFTVRLRFVYFSERARVTEFSMKVVFLTPTTTIEI